MEDGRPRPSCTAIARRAGRQSTIERSGIPTAPGELE